MQQAAISTINPKALKEIGKIAAARVVQKADDLTIMTSNGVTLRMKVKDVKQVGPRHEGRASHQTAVKAIALLRWRAPPLKT